MGSIHGSGWSPGVGNGNPLHILAWKVPWTERSLVGYNPWCCRVRHNWAHTCLSYTSLDWQITSKSDQPLGTIQPTGHPVSQAVHDLALLDLNPAPNTCALPHENPSWILGHPLFFSFPANTHKRPVVLSLLLFWNKKSYLAILQGLAWVQTHP